MEDKFDDGLKEALEAYWNPHDENDKAMMMCIEGHGYWRVKVKFKEPVTKANLVYIDSHGGYKVPEEPNGTDTMELNIWIPSIRNVLGRMDEIELVSLVEKNV